VKPRQPTGEMVPVWCEFRQTECLEDERVVFVGDIAPSHVEGAKQFKEVR
jgi:hypothetical protein